MRRRFDVKKYLEQQGKDAAEKEYRENASKISEKEFLQYIAGTFNRYLGENFMVVKEDGTDNVYMVCNYYSGQVFKVTAKKIKTADEKL